MQRDKTKETGSTHIALVGAGFTMTKLKKSNSYRPPEYFLQDLEEYLDQSTNLLHLLVPFKRVFKM